MRLVIHFFSLLFTFFATTATAGQCSNAVHRAWSDATSCSMLLPGLQSTCQSCVSGGGEFWTYQNASKLVNGNWISDPSQTCCSTGASGSGFSDAPSSSSAGFVDALSSSSAGFVNAPTQPSGSGKFSGIQSALQGGINALGSMAAMQAQQQQANAAAAAQQEGAAPS